MTVHTLFKRLMARIPEELPRDLDSMNRFVNDILATYNLPNTPEYQRAVTKAVHGVSQSSHRVPKYFFYSHMRRFEAMRAAVVKITELEKAATPKRESLETSEVTS